jgi:hypothetical protein
MAKPLLLLLADMSTLLRKIPDAILGIGMLLSVMASLLECWVDMAADGNAVKQQIAQHTAGDLSGAPGGAGCGGVGGSVLSSVSVAEKRQCIGELIDQDSRHRDIIMMQ